MERYESLLTRSICQFIHIFGSAVLTNYFSRARIILDSSLLVWGSDISTVLLSVDVRESMPTSTRSSIHQGLPKTVFGQMGIVK